MYKVTIWTEKPTDPNYTDNYFGSLVQTLWQTYRLLTVAVFSCIVERITLIIWKCINMIEFKYFP